MEGKTEEEIEMMKLMGFGSFDTSKVIARGCSTLCTDKEVQFISEEVNSTSELKMGILLHFIRPCLACSTYQCITVVL